MTGRFQGALAHSHSVVFTAVAGLAGFSTYFAMYAFRKPFTAATFPHVPGWHFALDYKIALILAQVAGYALSKFIGVKVISEIQPRHRAAAIIGLIAVSWLALLAFALVPAPWNVAALFLNGLPLGMIWGLVFGFMEGRRVSEVLASMMCASFILSSGVVKSVGAWLIQAWHVTPFWMPAATGALFMPLLLASVWVLSRLPPPDARDEAERVRRMPMTGAARAAFLKAYAPGLVAIILAYILLTAFRDFRDNFAAEIWTALGYGGEAAIFSASELPVAVIALIGMAAIIMVRDNRRALMVIHGMVAGGFALLGLSTLAFQAHLISPLAWMILGGSGLYVAYNPVNAVLFDRLVAVSGRAANAGFLIYVADSSGYMGSVALLLWRNFGQASLNWLQFFTLGAYVTGIAGTLATVSAAIYFHYRSRADQFSDQGRSCLPDQPHPRATDIIALIADIFERRGAEAYAGEALTVAEHMLQTATLAQLEGAPETLVAAALLHDIGHFTSEFGEYTPDDTEDKLHDESGAQVLEGFFPPAVTECVRLHVAAKRYLCATDPAYYDTLSAASKHSLKLQGGPMSEAEIAAFRRLPFHQEAVRLRRWDDSGKIVGLQPPPFAAFQPLLQRVMRPAA